MHLDILSEEQVNLLVGLGPFAASRGFHLAGGTAVALHLGHRRSEDFDFFNPEEFDPEELYAGLRAHFPFRLSQIAAGTLKGYTGGVKVEFLRHHFPILSGPDVWGGLGVASLDDLAAMKMLAVTHRSSKRDFIDIYFLALKHRPLGEMIDLYRRKYGTEDIGHLLRALVYFDPADRTRTPTMLVPLPWAEVKVALADAVAAFVNSE